MEKQNIPWEVIEARLTTLGKDQAWLARRLGASDQVVSNWTRRGVPLARAKQVADSLGMSADALLQLTSPNTPPREGALGKANPPYNEPVKAPPPSLISYPVDPSKFRRVYVVGRAQGGLPERIWTDGDYPVGATDLYADVATPDEHAFLVPVVGDSMSPRYNEGEFVLVEPSTEPELEDDVLVRLVTGETLIKRLLSLRHGIRLGSYNRVDTMSYRPEEILWMYYIAHGVPARKIKTRT
ncbi:S24 family peptidase [Cupriavidus basilensis]|uniref:S24 family peptidase n=1 Tax=Cupriavidus basilensis TaxID=68895 RepID=UPI0028476819|nr:S24 family peptidase [Cupriavidus basilensis]MDR3382289.1 S24 family peptidase [Cupriavidus basilensis]